MEAYNKYYSVTGDGRVYSHIRKRWLKPMVNSVGYGMVYLTDPGIGGKWVGVARLVASVYLGTPVGMEVNHKDHDKRNNSVGNLEWVTHSENIRKSYTEGYRKASRHMVGFRHTGGTKKKMAEAKYVRLEVVFNGVKTAYKSIQDFIDAVGIDRKYYNRFMDGHEVKVLEGYSIQKL